MEPNAMTILQQIGRASSEIEIRTASADFTQLARCLALAKGILPDARRIASERHSSERVLEILTRATPATMTSSTGSWGDDLSAYQTVAEGFLASLRNASAFDAMLPSMRVVPLRTRVVVTTVTATARLRARSRQKR